MSSKEEALVFVALGFSLAFCVVLCIRSAMMLWSKFKFEHEYLKHPRLIEYSSLRACQGPHQWTDVVLALRGIDPGDYKVCTDCGSILSNDDVMVSDEVLKQIKEDLEITAQRQAASDALMAQINETADAYVDQYIRREFSEEINDVHFGNKLKELVAYAFVAQAAAKDKITAENESRTNLDSRYSGWSSKVKGNA